MYVLENLNSPAGFFWGKYPEKVEAFIKRCFKRVIKHRYQASQDFFNGKHFNKTTSGKV
jgi:hypothetical protein